jgi:hypothetical protein
MQKSVSGFGINISTRTYFIKGKHDRLLALCPLKYFSEAPRSPALAARGIPAKANKDKVCGGRNANKDMKHRLP